MDKEYQSGQQVSCWSCTAINIRGARICQFCGEDLEARRATTPEEPPEENPPARPKPRNDSLIIVLAAFLACMIAVVIYELRDPVGGPSEQEVLIAASSIREIQRMVITSSPANGDFPASLDKYAKELLRPVGAALSAGYQIRYVPVNVSKNDRAGAFGITAVPTKEGSPSLYIDESGVVRISRQERPATPYDPAY